VNILRQILLYMHIISAIASIGPFFVFFPVLQKFRKADTVKQHAYLDTFVSAIRLAKHAGHVLVASGILLIVTGSWSWTDSWLIMTFAILIGSLAFVARAFTPKIRKFDEPGADKEQLVRLLVRSVWIYLILLMAMLWLMVAKPVLW